MRHILFAVIFTAPLIGSALRCENLFDPTNPSEKVASVVVATNVQKALPKSLEPLSQTLGTILESFAQNNFKKTYDFNKELLKKVMKSTDFTELAEALKHNPQALKSLNDQIYKIISYSRSTAATGEYYDSPSFHAPSFYHIMAENPILFKAVLNVYVELINGLNPHDGAQFASFDTTLLRDIADHRVSAPGDILKKFYWYADASTFERHVSEYHMFSKASLEKMKALTPVDQKNNQHIERDIRLHKIDLMNKELDLIENWRMTLVDAGLKKTSLISELHTKIEMPAWSERKNRVAFIILHIYGPGGKMFGGWNPGDIYTLLEPMTYTWTGEYARESEAPHLLTREYALKAFLLKTGLTEAFNKKFPTLNKFHESSQSFVDIFMELAEGRTP